MAKRPLFYFNLRRTTPLACAGNLAQLVEQVGLREDFTHHALALVGKRKPLAVIVSLNDYRSLLTRTRLAEEVAAESDASLPVADQELSALVSLCQDDEGGYRAFLIGNGEVRRAALLAAEPFLRLTDGGLVRLHSGEREVAISAGETAADDAARVKLLLQGMVEEREEQDLVMVRPGHEGAVALSAGRFVALHRERKIRGFGCPNCGLLSCHDWNEPLRTIRSGLGDLDIDQLDENLHDLLDQTESHDERYVVSFDGLPQAVFLSESDFAKLCFDDGKGVVREQAKGEVEIEF